MRDFLEMNPRNPSPFIQPFLYLKVKKNNGIYEVWWVDVGGKVKKYINCKRIRHDETTNYLGQTTKLMEEIMASFRELGHEIAHLGSYTGTAGPSHILRNGAFFKRMAADNY